MTQPRYDNAFLRKVIRKEVWFKRCPDCEATGFDYDTEKDCETCDGLGYVPIEGFVP